MDDEEEISQDLIDALIAFDERVDNAIAAAIRLLYDRPPSWIPDPNIERARRIIRKFLNDGFSPEDISNRVDEAKRDELIFPGIVTDPSAFAHDVYELAHLGYAIDQGKQIGLQILAGDQAAIGQKFKDGRKRGSVGPIRKAIGLLLKKSPNMKNAELWDALKAKPPRGWEVRENRMGKYIEGPNPSDSMTYASFINAAAKERKKIRAKIIG